MKMAWIIDSTLMGEKLLNALFQQVHPLVGIKRSLQSHRLKYPTQVTSSKSCSASKNILGSSLAKIYPSAAAASMGSHKRRSFFFQVWDLNVYTVEIVDAPNRAEARDPAKNKSTCDRKGLLLSIDGLLEWICLITPNETRYYIWTHYQSWGGLSYELPAYWKCKTFQA